MKRLVFFSILLSLFSLISFDSFAGDPPRTTMWLDVPGSLPSPPDADPPGGGGILEEPEATSIVFVLDRSGSMNAASITMEVPGIPSANRWQAVQYELGRAVDNLDPETIFSIVIFNHTYVMWRPMLVDATEANKDAAKGWVNSQQAQGGTSFVAPISAAIDIDGGPPEVIMFLSDGAPNEGYAAVASVTAANGGRSVINTVAMGVVFGAALTIMQDIANQNGGECRVVY